MSEIRNFEDRTLPEVLNLPPGTLIELISQPSLRSAIEAKGLGDVEKIIGEVIEEISRLELTLVLVRNSGARATSNIDNMCFQIDGLEGVNADLLKNPVVRAIREELAARLTLLFRIAFQQDFSKFVESLKTQEQNLTVKLPDIRKGSATLGPAINNAFTTFVEATGGSRATGKQLLAWLLSNLSGKQVTIEVEQESGSKKAPRKTREDKDGKSAQKKEDQPKKEELQKEDPQKEDLPAVPAVAVAQPKKKEIPTTPTRASDLEQFHRLIGNFVRVEIKHWPLGIFKALRFADESILSDLGDTGGSLVCVVVKRSGSGRAVLLPWPKNPKAAPWEPKTDQDVAKLFGTEEVLPQNVSEIRFPKPPKDSSPEEE